MITYRELSLADESLILGAEAVVYRALHIEPYSFGLTRPFFAERTRFSIGAFVEEKLIGYFLAYQNVGSKGNVYWYIRDVAVLEGFRKQGIASEFHRQFVALSKPFEVVDDDYLDSYRFDRSGFWQRNGYYEIVIRPADLRALYREDFDRRGRQKRVVKKAGVTPDIRIFHLTDWELDNLYRFQSEMLLPEIPASILSAWKHAEFVGRNYSIGFIDPSGKLLGYCLIYQPYLSSLAEHGFVFSEDLRRAFASSPTPIQWPVFVVDFLNRSTGHILKEGYRFTAIPPIENDGLWEVCFEPA